MEARNGSCKESSRLFGLYLPALQETEAVPRGAGRLLSDIDVTTDKAARDEMVKKTGQMSVPVIFIDGEMIIGFEEDRLKKALGLAA